MKKHKYTSRLVSLLILSSLILYLINYMIFRDIHHIIMFFTEDLAFIPIEVIITVLIIEKELERREKYNKLQKINLLIEIFFEEVGNELLATIACKDEGNINLVTLIEKNTFGKIENILENHNYMLKLKTTDIEEIYKLLYENKESFLRFLENPYLGEHDVFTDLLQATIHLYSEIKFRYKKGSLNDDDISHLNKDIIRVYKFLSKEWIVYIKYIEKEYPFLYSFAIDSLPFIK